MWNIDFFLQHVIFDFLIRLSLRSEVTGEVNLATIFSAGGGGNPRKMLPLGGQKQNRKTLASFVLAWGDKPEATPWGEIRVRLNPPSALPGTLGCPPADSYIGEAAGLLRQHLACWRRRGAVQRGREHHAHAHVNLILTVAHTKVRNIRCDTGRDLSTIPETRSCLRNSILCGNTKYWRHGCHHID